MNRVSSNGVEERLGPNPEAEPPPAHDSLEQMTKDIQDQAATVVSDAFVAKQSKVKNTNPRRSDDTKIEDVIVMLIQLMHVRSCWLIWVSF